ncbi:MAG: alpha/beta hydrolase [Lachnospiraceae bacterium]|nr:alpha/beta hydrolase [Lachnospiraceae bacterium]
MNPVLKYLSTNARKRVSQIISASDVQHEVPAGLTEIPDLTYSGHNGALLAADVYRPKDPGPGRLPVIVMIHGGGLFVGSRKSSRIFCENMAQRGFLVFAPEYRLLDEADGIEAAGDICDGLSFVADSLDSLGGDPDRIFVIGESAGAFLALYASAAASSLKIRRAFGVPDHGLSVRGLVCFGGMFYTAGRDVIGAVYKKDIFGKRRKDKAFMTLIDPEKEEVTGSLPPVLLVSSKADFLRSYTLRYRKALKAAGHECRLLYFREGKELTHAFPSLKPHLDESRKVMDVAAAWFRKL